MRAALFLDRDGTINIERDYLHQVADFALESGVAEAFALIPRLLPGWAIVVVTNQSGIARGYYSESQMHQLHRHMNRILLKRSGVQPDSVLHCPHHPQATLEAYRCDCHCRKPRPGMLLQAARRLNLDLSLSWMIGDKPADIGAARAAGCAGAVLVETGYGAQTPDAAVEDALSQAAQCEGRFSWHRTPDIVQAVRKIATHQSTHQGAST